MNDRASKIPLAPPVDRRENYLFFLLCLAVSFFFYLPARDAKFVNDTFYYLYEIETTGWRGILHSYNMIFLWHVPSVAYYILYKLFGLHWLGWHIAFSALHAINAVLLYALLKRIFSSGKVWQAASAFLFLVSPFQTEVVAWGAALHYLMIVTFLLGGLLAMLSYFQSNRIKFIFYYHLFFASSLSCFEQAFLYPVLFLLFAILIIPFSVAQNRAEILKVFTGKFLLPNFVFIALYFVLTKWTYGTWVAHYGASKHVLFSFSTMYECMVRYCMKFLFFFRELPTSWKQFLISPVPWKIVFIVLPLLALSLMIWFFKRKEMEKSYVFLFFLVSFILMLAPVLNLDQSFHFEIQSDRYGYIASVFFYPLLIFTAYNLFSKKTFYVFIGLEVIVCSILLLQSVHLWSRAGAISMSLLKKYPLQPGQQAYVVNLPDNYRGAYMFRNGFNEGLSLVHHKYYKASPVTVAWVNIFTDQNETSNERLSDSTFYVKCTHDGKWYYYLGHGAVDYETKMYKVDFDEWNTAYNWTIKQMPADTAYILQCSGDTWKVVDTLH